MHQHIHNPTLSLMDLTHVSTCLSLFVLDVVKGPGTEDDCFLFFLLCLIIHVMVVHRTSHIYLSIFLNPLYRFGMVLKVFLPIVPLSMTLQLVRESQFHIPLVYSFG